MLWFLFNSKCWLSWYYEDWLTLTQTFPMIYLAFFEGDFTVKHAANSGSVVPFDEALEKEYNMSAKGPSATIGYTQRKESVRKLNIISGSSLIPYMIYLVLTTRVNIPFIAKFQSLQLKQTRYVWLSQKTTYHNEEIHLTAKPGHTKFCDRNPTWVFKSLSLGIFLKVFQRLKNQQSYRPKRKKRCTKINNSFYSKYWLCKASWL